MEIKPGYKQSDVGLVPEDWSVLTLANTCKGIYRGASPRPIADPIWFDNNSDIGWVRISDVTEANRILLETKQRVSKQGVQRSRFVPAGNLIMSIAATVGRPILTGIDACIHDGFVVFERVHISKSFLYHKLSSMESSWSAEGQTGSQMNLNTDIIKRAKIVVPPSLVEQENIAEVLNDTDTYIDSLEQLISKKRQIKQGAMQELLQPKEGWLEKRLGSSAVLKARIGWQGLTTAEYLEAGNYYLVTGTEFKDGYIDWSNCHYVAESRYKQDKNIQLKERDVLVTKDGTIGKVALVTHLEKPATLNSGVFVIRPIGDAFSPEFFYYLLLSNVFTKFLNQLSAGSTINHLYQKDFVNFVYKTPITIAEQIAIATILSDMDAELEELESKLTKARQIKRGMMQELLTGRIRLI